MKISNADLRDIMKHINTTNHEMGVVQRDVAILKTDVAWLKKFQWIILSTSIGALILQLCKILIGG